MDSPVKIPFKSFINIDKKATTPIYLQIVFEFIKAIQMGWLPEGTKLPGTRILSEILHLNRNTLIKSFNDLESQGFIEIRPNKGTFVLSTFVKSKPVISGENSGKKLKEIRFKKSTLLESPIETSNLPLQFNEGFPDNRIIHSDVLARIYLSQLKREKHKKLAALNPIIHAEFKQTIANYLNLTRGINKEASNLLTTNSHELALFVLIKALVESGDKVAIIHPGYYLSNMVFADSGAEIMPIPLDEEGLDLNYLLRVLEQTPIRIFYLNSNYHFPTTKILSAKRKIELLELSRKYDFIILEDDYDYDFHFDSHAVLPLAAMAASERVIYVGSISRTLPPGFGFGFIASTPELIKELSKHQKLIEPNSDLLKESVLIEWINEGEIHRSDKKNRKIYKDRRDYFIQLLNLNFKDKIEFEIPTCGLGMWIEWKVKFNLVKFKKECAKQGLFIPSHLLFQDRYRTATRLGFGNFNKEEMDKVFSILKKSLANLTA